MNYVQCSVCGKRVSNIVSEELYIRAYIECPECIIDTHKSETFTAKYKGICVFCDNPIEIGERVNTIYIDSNRETISHELCAKGRVK
jgi:uncharacterized protein CbrC (UPF0167 family)